MYCIRFLFFKQKTAYEVRISDWSSDVCSSDLPVDDVNQTFLFTRMIPVVIHADQIAQFIEYKFMCIAKPGREYFEIASVGIGPDNHALVRVFPFPAVWPPPVEADVAGRMSTRLNSSH